MHAQTQPAAGKTDRAPSAAMMRGALVVAALSRDTTRASRRAQDAIKRRGLEFAAMPADKASPNWLKIALLSR